MSDKHDCFLAQLLLDGVVEDVVSHMSIQCAQRVIQNVDGPVTVQGSSQADPLTLTATEVGTPLANLIRDHTHTHTHRKKSNNNE